MVDEIMARDKKIKPHKWSTVNRTKWSRAIKANVQVCARRKEDEDERARKIKESEDAQGSVLQEEAKDDQTVNGNDTAIMFTCNRCSHKVPSNRKAFQTNALDTKTWCGKCKNSWEIKAHNCPCGKAWFKCGMHANHKEEDTGGDVSQQISREKVGGTKTNQTIQLPRWTKRS